LSSPANTINTAPLAGHSFAAKGVLQDVSNPLGLGTLAIRNLALGHLLVLSSEAEAQEEAEHDGSGGHDGVGGESDPVSGRVFLVVQIGGPDLRNWVHRQGRGQNQPGSLRMQTFDIKRTIPQRIDDGIRSGPLGSRSGKGRTDPS